MGRTWTFGQRIGVGFATMVALALLIGAVSIQALRSVVADKDRVISENAQSLIGAARMEATLERKASNGRAFLLSGEQRFLERMREARASFSSLLGILRAQSKSADSRPLLDAIERTELAHQAAFDRVIAMRGASATVETIVRAFDDDIAPRYDELHRAITAFVDHEAQGLEEGRRASTEAAASATTAELGIAGVAIVLAIVLALWLAGSLSRQIGSAVSHIQSSSAELEAAAAQQATGSREQSSATSEVSTTIRELLSTSKQIAESAQRVARIAEETASGARTGDQTVQRAQDGVGVIKRQVDLIVGHMLDLGKKSQQVGGILEIITELADQTNILAINATIESAGAGEAGKRFAVVADEIRKLADRVGGSTKEIRTLIEEIRAAANTTVMATEDGSKAVDAGTRQFGEVAAAFKQIERLVVTTTEAAREIELSTKQQSTAVEQVNAAISNVAQTTKEAEASTRQTLETSTQLATLSRGLAALVQPRAQT